MAAGKLLDLDGPREIESCDRQAGKMFAKIRVELGPIDRLANRVRVYRDDTVTLIAVVVQQQRNPPPPSPEKSFAVT